MTIKKKINLSIIILVLLVVVSSFFLFVPLLNSIKQDSDKFSFQKEQIYLLESRIKNLENFKKASSENEVSLKKIDGIFIDPAVPVDFITFIEKTADDLGLSHKISPSSSIKNKQDKWLSLVFEVNLGGSFPNLMKFLEKMENSIYLIKIKNLNISSSSGGGIKTKIGGDALSSDIESVVLIEVLTHK